MELQVIDEELVRQRRVEFNRTSFKAMLWKNKEHVCACCGSDVDIELHHIVPLALGGTNRPTNITPLCYACHQRVHGCKNVKKVRRSEINGRPRKVMPSNYKDILMDYCKGKIGYAECRERLGYTRGYKLTDSQYFNEFKEEYNIKTVKNRIDKLKSMGIRKFDDIVTATVYYYNGSVVEYSNGKIYS